MLVILTCLIFLLFLPQALAPNVVSIILTRFFQGTMACIEVRESAPLLSFG